MSARRVFARAAVAAFVVAAAGIVLSAWQVHTAGQAHARRRAARQRWDVWDDEVDDEPSAIELEMLARNDFLNCDRAHALRMDLEGDDLCPPS